MKVSGQEDRVVEFTTPARVQAWFLRRSRELWKSKYKQVKCSAKRSQNRVNDVTKSRQRWREQAEEFSRRVRELEAENAALQEQLAALKKDGVVGTAGLGRR
jgi:chromosome segregation ATPase